LKEPAGFKVGDVAIDLAAITTPILVIALKDDHVSAWEAVYRGARHLGAHFILGGSGHNAGIVNPPSAHKHGYWTNDQMPESAQEWIETATRHEGSWWPWWTNWLEGHSSKKSVTARKPKDPIEPAPGRYAMMP
jgi:polyhydroxyalkanoate synthase